ncbi:MAG: phosphoglycerate dehydrogenase [Ruminococcus sp.]|nr:phosphoglycerate dehydrogenase [Ruminococcus sp.]
MYNVLTLNKIATCGTSIFDTTKYTVSDSVENPDAILVRSAKMHDMEFSPNLLAIGRAGAGTNNIPVDKCAEQGICVFNTPGANANAVKEIVICGLLLSSRKVTEAIDWAKTLQGTEDVAKQVEKGKSQFVGPEISGKTLGIIGLGAIGRLVANAVIELGMKVIGTDPFLTEQGKAQLHASVKIVDTKEEVYKEADYITVHVPCNNDTKGFINADTIAQMKDGVRILNFARGELVNDIDIKEALSSGKVAKYVTDFPNENTVGVENLIAIPHLGASTPESEDNCAVMAVNEIIEYIEKGNIINSVNLPNATLDAVGTKVCIIHKNIPDIVSKITSIFGNDGLNIENMVNKSKGDFAYTMLDINGEVPCNLVDKIQSNDNIIKVRVINK